MDAARVNGVALVDVSNRGRKMVADGFNARRRSHDPQTDADLGDGFLTRRRLHAGLGRLAVRRPRRGRPDGDRRAGCPRRQRDRSRAEFTPNDRAPKHTVADLAGYPPADPARADTTLTVRDGPFGTARRRSQRGRWTLRGNVVTMRGGFEPGGSTNWRSARRIRPIAGAGPGRVSRFRRVDKHARRRAWSARAARCAFGSSQSGRFLRTFLYYGFNADEKGRQVFDGVMAHIAGAARLSLNERGATPNALVDVQRDAVSRSPTPATRDPIERAHRRAARQRPRPPASAEDLLHEHRGRILGRRPRRPRSSTRRRTASPT